MKLSMCIKPEAEHHPSGQVDLIWVECTNSKSLSGICWWGEDSGEIYYVSSTRKDCRPQSRATSYHYYTIPPSPHSYQQN